MQYTELDVWKRTRELANMIYTVTRSFPKEESFGLVSQMRRSAVSIPSNLAEGCGRQSKKEAVQFYYIARGSLFELETQLYLAFDQKYLDQRALQEILCLVSDCKRLVHGFINYSRSLPPRRRMENRQHENSSE
jgi:four helix bundle protein